jgi:hypothetical protein
MSVKSETLKMMGVFSHVNSNISNNLNVFPPVQWNKVRHRISEHPQEAFISPMPCPPLQFGKTNTKNPMFDLINPHRTVLSHHVFHKYQSSIG